MGKNVILSFDDGRKDTFKNALPIIKKYNLKCTINITTDFITNPQNHKFESCSNEAMTIDDVCKCITSDYVEIASHSNTHCNDLEDIKKSIEILKNWAGKDIQFGFASPYSSYDREDSNKIQELFKEVSPRYLRTGIQVRRESFFYKVFYVFEKIMKSSSVFYLLNKKNIIRSDSSSRVFVGVTIDKDTTVRQIKKLISKLNDNESVILIFHSVLTDEERNLVTGKWYYDIEKFDELCNYLSKSDVNVIKNCELA